MKRPPMMARLPMNLIESKTPRNLEILQKDPSHGELPIFQSLNDSKAPTICK